MRVATRVPMAALLRVTIDPVPAMRVATCVPMAQTIDVYVKKNVTDEEVISDAHR